MLGLSSCVSMRQLSLLKIPVCQQWWRHTQAERSQQRANDWSGSQGEPNTRRPTNRTKGLSRDIRHSPANTYLLGACVPGSGPGSGNTAMIQIWRPSAWDKSQTQPAVSANPAVLLSGQQGERTIRASVSYKMKEISSPSCEVR